jgi:hypothetical protein
MEVLENIPLNNIQVFLKSSVQLLCSSLTAEHFF